MLLIVFNGVIKLSLNVESQVRMEYFMRERELKNNDM